MNGYRKNVPKSCSSRKGYSHMVVELKKYLDTQKNFDGASVTMNCSSSNSGSKSGVCDAARDPPSTNAVANDGINGLAIWSSASVCADIFNLVFQDHKRNQNSTGR